jgi:hypothetical protein
MVTQGGRVESQSDFDAVIANGKEVNHVLHAILTVFTCLICLDLALSTAPRHSRGAETSA